MKGKVYRVARAAMYVVWTCWYTICSGEGKMEEDDSLLILLEKEIAKTERGRGRICLINYVFTKG